jgi:type IV pilus assembly protein PilA
MSRVLRTQEGFSFVEVLVVILIVGILAAIALPSLLQHQGKGHDAVAKADVRNAMSLIEACRVDQDDYDGCASPRGLPAGVGVTTSGTGYTAVAHSTTGTDFTVAKHADGTVRRSCAPSGGTCPSGGSW